MVDAVLVGDLQRQEGLRLAAYPDPLSPRAKNPKNKALSGAPWTIGYGHTGPEVVEGLAWTMAEALEGLERDVAHHCAELDAKAPWVRALDPERRRVMQNMMFNLGWDRLSKFVNTLAKVRAGDYTGAAAGMEASLWYTQTGNRAKTLVRQMRTGGR